MKKGNYKLAEQIGNKGYFASIGIEVVKSDDASNIIKYHHFDFEKWSNSIEFGFDCFKQKFLRHYKSKLEGLTITITELEYQIVDTTPTIMTFVFIKALCEVFDLPKNIHPIFDNETGKFIFDN